MADEAQKKDPRGASAERMRELTRIRMEKAKTDPKAKGGRPRTRYNRAEVEEHALKRLMPRALQVLEEQLEDPDQRVRQKAALEVIAYVKGKPTQTVKSESNEVHTIRYESAAFRLLDGGHPDIDQLPPAA